jgi:hypothetical protein
LFGRLWRPNPGIKYQALGIKGSASEMSLHA